MREGRRVRRNLHHTLHYSHFTHTHVHTAIRGAQPEAFQSSHFLLFAAKINYVTKRFSWHTQTTEGGTPSALAMSFLIAFPFNVFWGIDIFLYGLLINDIHISVVVQCLSGISSIVKSIFVVPRQFSFEILFSSPLGMRVGDSFGIFAIEGLQCHCAASPKFPLSLVLHSLAPDLILGNHLNERLLHRAHIGRNPHAYLLDGVAAQVEYYPKPEGSKIGDSL